MDHKGRRIGELYPELTGELVDLLREEGEDGLASSVPFLRFVEWCPCSDGFCKSFHTAPRPEGAYGPGHRSVPRLPAKGMIVVDVVHNEIKFVEIIDRDSLT